jgi:hypothetical protein
MEVFWGRLPWPGKEHTPFGMGEDKVGRIKPALRTKRKKMRRLNDGLISLRVNWRK